MMDSNGFHRDDASLHSRDANPGGGRSAREVGNNFSNTVSFVCISTIAWLYTQYDGVGPYMDEVFHVPQAKAYCDGNFSHWDDKITTLPGLYYVSYIIFRLFNFANYWFQFIHHNEGESFCSYQYLRVHNIAVATIAIFIYRRCYDSLHKYELTKTKKNDDDTNDKNIESNDDVEYLVDSRHIQRLVAITLLLYPLNFFYYFMYYTDTMSNVLLIMTYTYALQWKFQTSFISKLLLLLLASLSILLRQTNAIWVLFIAGTSMLQYLENERFFHDNDFSISSVVTFIKLLVTKLLPLLSLSWPLLAPVSGFVYFVYNNGSIVVGDKDNHQITLHPAMPLHMLVICSVFISPKVLPELFYAMKCLKETKIKDLLQFTSTLKLATAALAHILGLLLTFSMLVYGSKSHPFLLADNRHYTFYLWRWFLSKQAIRILLTPIYYFLIIRVMIHLRQRRGPIWIMIYLVATLTTLLPASLLELRYFTPGVLIFVLNGSLRVSSSLYILIGIFAITNGIMINNFLERTYTWSDGSIARFMP